SITYVIDKLEKKKFLYRRKCPEDRRVMFACMTDEGRAYMDKRVTEQEALINTIFDEWNDDEVEDAIQLLKRIGMHAESLLKLNLEEFIMSINNLKEILYVTALSTKEMRIYEFMIIVVIMIL